VQSIRHQQRPNTAAGIDEARTGIDPAHAVAVGEPRNPCVDVGDLRAQRIVGSPARQERVQQNDRVRESGAHLVDDCRQTPRDLDGRGGLEVVGAGHDHDHPRVAALEFAVLHAPQDELRAVAFDSEVCNAAQRHDRAVPYLGAPGRKKSGDRIAEEQDVDAALRGARDEGVMLLAPPVLRPRTRRRDPGAAGTGRRQRRRTRRKVGGIHGSSLAVQRSAASRAALSRSRCCSKTFG